MVMTVSKAQGVGYYTSLAKASYYTEEGEAKGLWMGKGAQDLGLTGEVSNSDFLNLYRGYTPDGQTKMVQNAGKENRVGGWDLTFSVPKSVSVLWATADLETRKQIEKGVLRAVEQTFSYLEDEVITTRRGKGGEEQEHGKLVGSFFMHSSNRNGDMQLHGHLVCHNLAIREDGTSGTIDSRFLYKTEVSSGAIFRSLAAHEMNKLGFEVERVKDKFELVGRNEEACEKYSSRTAEIKKAMEETGFTSYHAERYVTLQTRKSKDPSAFSRSEQFDVWQETCEQEFGIKKGKGQEHHARGEQQTRTKEQFYQDVIKELTEKNSTFVLHKFKEVVAVNAQTENLSFDELRSHMSVLEQRLVEVDREKGLYTTKEHLQKEEAIVKIFKESIGDVRHEVSSKTVDRIISERNQGEYKLTSEQENAIRHITSQQTGYISVIQGLAGVGKTRGVLQESRKAFEAEGHKVIGVAPTGKASAGLRDAGIKETHTLHSILLKQKAYEQEQLRIKETGKTAAEIYQEDVQKWRESQNKGFVQKRRDFNKKVDSFLFEAKKALRLVDERELQEFIDKYPPTSKLKHAGWEAVGKISHGYRIALDNELERQQKTEAHRQEHPELYDSDGNRMNHPEGGYFTAGNVYFLDEAGMVDTDIAGEFLALAQKTGGSVKKVGDDNQFSSVKAGGAFSMAKKVLECAELTEVKRQDRESDREALKDFALKTDPSKLVEEFDIRYYSTPKGAEGALFRAWEKQELQAGKEIEDSAMLVETNASVFTLNEKAQKARFELGQLGKEKTIEVGGVGFYQNDRILFRHNHKDKKQGYDLKNGDAGTVVEVEDAESVKVRLDNGTEHTVNLRLYHEKVMETDKDVSVQLGYASTTDSKQGATIKRVYGYTGERTAKEFAYVQASRHTEEVKLFTIKETSEEKYQRDKEEREDLRQREEVRSRAWHVSDEIKDKYFNVPEKTAEELEQEQRQRLKNRFSKVVGKKFALQQIEEAQSVSSQDEKEEVIEKSKGFEYDHEQMIKDNLALMIQKSDEARQKAYALTQEKREREEEIEKMLARDAVKKEIELELLSETQSLERKQKSLGLEL